ncbi:sulfatase family protein [Reichenbachiella versicolor]|uniref:sulfatase family protein n=1 Tax=Reichenbachiella versicolor TaxID=1821036 RepID=UPI000D6DDC90|nr:arylsulfatase [Reichenbachiella versicolor]
MKKTIYLLLLSTISLTSCNQNKDVQVETPNVIVILADDMGYGDIQYYNKESKISTPNLNQLCEEGMMFTDAHTNSAVCTPTRYGLLTGRYAWRTRLKRGVLSGYSDHLIESSTMTIASLLKSKGYNTAVIGKWHLGQDLPWTQQVPAKANSLNYISNIEELDYTKSVQNGPNTIGFDYSYIIGGSLDMGPYVYFENGMATMVPDSLCPKVNFPAYIRSGETATDFNHQTAMDNFTERAITYISKQAQSENPFFLYFPLTGPHKPALPAERFIGKSGLGPYGDMVMQVDWTVGKVIQTLKETGIEENTLVIYTSDNGSYMYEYEAGEPSHESKPWIQGFAQDQHRANYVWRGTKADIYEGGHRVPFIVKWPSKIEPLTTSNQLIATNDVLATLAQIVGVKLENDEGEDSYSFYRELLGYNNDARPPLIHHSVNGTFSLREGEWKLIASDGSGGRQNPKGKPFQKPYQLYAIDQDPTEQMNVIDKYPHIAEQMIRQLEEIKNDDN